MTPTELQQLEDDALAEALIIGGQLVVLLGLRRTTSRITWDSVRGKFIIDGRTVSIRTIRKLLMDIETQVGSRMALSVDDLEAERITVDEWQREQKRRIGAAHVLAGALAVGSISAAASLAEVVSRVIAERSYADEFARELRKRKKTLTFARIKSRARSYARAVHITYSVAEQNIRGALGYKEAKRVRRASESCEGCVEWSGKWVPINDMPKIGTLQCAQHCRCYMEYQ